MAPKNGCTPAAQSVRVRELQLAGAASEWQATSKRLQHQAATVFTLIDDFHLPYCLVIYPFATFIFDNF